MSYPDGIGKTQKLTNSGMSWSRWLNKTKSNHMLKELSEESHETRCTGRDTATGQVWG